MLRGEGGDGRSVDGWPKQEARRGDEVHAAVQEEAALVRWLLAPGSSCPEVSVEHCLSGDIRNGSPYRSTCCPP